MARIVATVKQAALVLLCSLAYAAAAAVPNITLCWGDGSSGQLGDGIDGRGHLSSVPVPVAGNQSFAAVCTREAHSCALDEAGRAFCWGSGSQGALGTGSNASALLPAAVLGSHTFRSIACGAAFTCALDGAGQTWCWGDGSAGQLGNGNFDSFSTPVAAAKEHTFRMLTAGWRHVCGIGEAGDAWCWGHNGEGQLGAGVEKDASALPVKVAGDHMFGFISSGVGTTCAIEPHPTARAWCWGDGAGGELGNGGDSDQRSPVPVSGDGAFSASTGGWLHSCAITLDNETVCWGSSPGNGFNTDSYNPVAVAPGHAFVSLTAGVFHTCGLDASGAIWCFGDDSLGQLGNGTSGRTVVAPVEVAGGHIFLALGDALNRHTCAIATQQASTAPESSTGTGVGAAAGTGPAPSSSSSTPVGAIAGGVAAGVVALAVLAFFALRPGKGWLRRKPSTSPNLEDGDSAAAQLAAREADSFWKSTSSRDKAARTSTVLAVPTPAQTASQATSAYSPSSDIVLSLIASYLTTHPQAAARSACSEPAMLTPDAQRGSGGSGALELRTDARMWEVQWQELNILRLIGRGSFGFVYLAEWNYTQVAVKVLVSKDDVACGEMELPDRVMRELQAEAGVMSRMRHPNVVQFMGLVALPPALITEYCSRGSLYDCLAAARDNPAAAAQLTWHRRLSLAADAGAGLLYLHHRNIIHRDDFNLSKILEGAQLESSVTSGGATNPIWLAPEVLEGERATAASDVYSFGMVLFELLTWRLPWTFTDMSPFKVGAIVRRGGRPEVPPRDQLPGVDTAGWTGLDAYVQLMRDCWAQQPQDRPSFDEVVGRLQGLLDATPDS
ncbi:hypothetical protein COHA_002303 [Chlorella ohadii]|uniref:Protein kinase domain-containing protein n=1 Tax=Chlorella ohadii TaxID=2649997 RepID=A0AAD5DXF8_9CHLO|nr:hypothetical protein COHA_002303 [Chlorella ohadii]